jgi:hypothetical protein
MNRLGRAGAGIVVLLVAVHAPQMPSGFSAHAATNPNVVQTTPQASAMNVRPWKSLLIRFDKALDPDSVTPGTVIVRDAQNTIVSGSLSLGPGTDAVSFDPDGELSPMTAYTATVNGGVATPAVKDLGGLALLTSATWSFQTGPADTENPTITATRFPRPNPQGWNLEPVTLTFECRDEEYTVEECPEPLTIDTDGVHEISRTIVDEAGRPASVSVTVSIDQTPPIIEIAYPEAGDEISGTQLEIAANVQDTGSGLWRTVCTGDVVATVTGTEVTCTVLLTRKGPVTVRLMAADAAGNVASLSVPIVQTGAASSLSAAPQSVTLLPTTSRHVQLFDDYGREVLTANWISSDEGVAVLAEEGNRYVIQAVGPGSATLSATWSGMTASVEVAVGSGVQLPVGTALWTAPASEAGFQAYGLVKADRVDSGWASVFTVEYNVNDYRPLTRAINAEGAETLRVDAVPLFAHSQGGFVSHGTPRGGWEAPESTTLERYGSPDGSRDWRFEAPSGTHYGAIVQDRAGYIYAVGLDDDSYVIDVIRGDTGVLHRRFKNFPTGTDLHLGMECYPGSDGPVSTTTAVPSQPVIDSDGNVVVSYGVSNSKSDWLGCDNGPNTYSYDESVYVLRMVNGSPLTPARMYYFETSEPGVLGLYASAGPPIVNDSGDVLVPLLKGRDFETLEGVLLPLEANASDRGAPAVRTTSLMLSGPGNVAFGRDFETGHLTKTNLSSGQVMWVSEVNATPVKATADGGVVAVATEVSGRWYTLDASGEVTQTLDLGNDTATFDPGAGWLAVRDGVPVQVAAPGIQQSFEFVSQSPIGSWLVGNAEQQGAPTSGCRVPFIRQWRSLVPGEFNSASGNFQPTTYVYKFEGFTSSDHVTGINAAFQKWTQANMESGLNVSFRAWAPTDAGYQIEIEKVASLPSHLNVDGFLVDTIAYTDRTTFLTDQGMVIAAKIQFTSDTAWITNATGHEKFALHEIGHLLGLDHIAGAGERESVTNTAIGTDDSGNNIPTTVPSCDIETAKKAPRRSWPWKPSR